jgi:hypothetical protein
MQAHLVADRHGGEPQHIGDVLCLDSYSFVVVTTGCDRGGLGGFVLSEVKNTAYRGLDRACKFVANTPVCKDLTFGTILLSCECIQDGVSRCDVCDGGMHDVKVTVFNVESDFLEATWVIVRGGARVLTRVEKQVESDDNYVSDGLAVRCSGCVECLMKNVNDNYDRDGFYLRRGVVLFGVGPELMVDPKVNVAKGILVDVRGPQSCERLTHRVDGICHRVRSEGIMEGVNASIPILLGK